MFYRRKGEEEGRTEEKEKRSRISGEYLNGALLATICLERDGRAGGTNLNKRNKFLRRTSKTGLRPLAISGNFSCSTRLDQVR